MFRKEIRNEIGNDDATKKTAKKDKITVELF